MKHTRRMTHSELTEWHAYIKTHGGFGLSFCNVCDKNPAFGVCNCSFGAMSMAYCTECFKHNAEPEFGLQYMADMCDGDLSKLVPEVKQMHMYRDGTYISIEEWIKDWKPTDYNDVDQNSEYVEDIHEQDIL